MTHRDDTTEQFMALAERQKTTLHKICRLFARDNAALSEDLYQEMIIDLWKAFPKIPPTADEQRWTFTIVYHTAIANYRQRLRDIKTTKITPFTPHPHTTQEDETNDSLEKIYEQLRLLPNEQQQIMMLHLDGYKYEEIAQTLGLDKNYVGTRIHRIKEQLKKKLAI